MRRQLRIRMRRQLRIRMRRQLRCVSVEEAHVLQPRRRSPTAGERQCRAIRVSAEDVEARHLRSEEQRQVCFPAPHVQHAPEPPAAHGTCARAEDLECLLQHPTELGEFLLTQVARPQGAVLRLHPLWHPVVGVQSAK